MKVFATKNFVVESSETPHVDRNDGGHLVIVPKVKILDRQHLTPGQAIELMRLTTVVGEAMTNVMTKHGVPIGRINYQDMGNWGHFLHYHIYGRATSAKFQKYGETVHTPLRPQFPEFYARFKPLTKKDVAALQKEMTRLFKTKKYSNAAWKI
jgi:diadenosine tetraphosphate (Ap4A) HIT family hydrolase